MWLAQYATAPLSTPSAVSMVVIDSSRTSALNAPLKNAHNAVCQRETVGMFARNRSLLCLGSGASVSRDLVPRGKAHSG